MQTSMRHPPIPPRVKFRGVSVCFSWKVHFGRITFLVFFFFSALLLLCPFFFLYFRPSLSFFSAPSSSSSRFFPPSSLSATSFSSPFCLFVFCWMGWWAQEIWSRYLTHWRAVIVILFCHFTLFLFWFYVPINPLCQW